MAERKRNTTALFALAVFYALAHTLIVVGSIGGVVWLIVTLLGEPGGPTR